MNDAVSKNRWERKRKLLPSLKLQYPSIDELAEIASLAGVKKSNQKYFESAIRSIILDAHLHTASMKEQSIPEAKKILRRLGTKALQLTNILRTIDIDLNTTVVAGGTKQLAGMLLEHEIGESQSTEKLVLVPEYIELLTALNKASLQALESLKAKRGPKGAAGSRAFPIFVETLWPYGRSWTNYQAAAGPFQGSFVDALKIMEPYLPKNFFPLGDLGRSIEHILDKQTERITKFRGSET